MSDPVTNVEIEDVLSSIRRLVSNGQADRLSGEKPAPQGHDVSGVDRLVLTPALRVDETAPAPEGMTAEIPLAEVDTGEAWGDAVDPEQDAVAHGSARHDGIPKGQAPEKAETATPKDAPSELGAQAAEFEAMVAGRDDQWEPDGASDDDYSGGAAISPLNWSEPDEAETEAEDDASEGAPSADPDWAEADDLASARHVQDWQDADAAGTPAAETDRGEGLLMDDAVLDEEALRDLVAEIVRQELQGALGERITRNVRKLVRREIHRALNSQDFD